MRQFKISKSVTERLETNVEKYLTEISRIPLLTPEEEVETVLLAKAGNIEAQTKLVKANLRFVVSVAKKYANKQTLLSDLINEGNIALIKSIKLYEPERGFKFISYAVWWIRQHMIEYTNLNGNTVYIPRNKTDFFLRIRNFIIQYECEFGEPPLDEVIIEHLRLNPAVLKAYWMYRNTKAISLDAPMLSKDAHHENSTLGELIKEPVTLDQYHDTEANSIMVSRLLKTLTEREQLIVTLYYNIGNENLYPMTLEDISEKIGLTRGRIRQILTNAIKKLQRSKTLKNIG